MIDGPRRIELKIFQSIKRVSMILWQRSQYISLSDRMKPMGSHIKRFNLEFANWAYEVPIGLGFIKILLGLWEPC